MNSERRWRIAFCTLLRVEFTNQTREAVFHHLNTGKRGYKLYDVQWNKICLRHFWNVDITFQLRKRFRRRRQAYCKNKKFLIRYKSSQYNLHDFLWIIIPVSWVNRLRFKSYLYRIWIPMFLKGWQSWKNDSDTHYATFFYFQLCKEIIGKP